MPVRNLDSLRNAAADIEQGSAEDKSVRSSSAAPHTVGLHSMPPEILENMAYHAVAESRATNTSFATSASTAHTTGDEPTVPPAAIPALLLTCKRLNKYLNTRSNPNLYARIFATRFDIGAIARRYGRAAIEPRALVRELKRRCRILKGMRMACELGKLRPEGNTHEADEALRETLWLAYLMLTENDGLNLLALRWANIRYFYLLYHTQEMLESALQPGYPPDSEERSLALHIDYLTTDPADLANEDKEEAVERLFVLRPFVFASHRFECFYAPWTLRELPISDPSKAREEHLRSLNPAETRSFLAVHRPEEGRQQTAGAHAAGGDSDEQDGADADTDARGDPSSSRRNPFLADLTPRSKATYVEHCGRKLRMCAPVASHAAYFSFFMQVEKDPNAGGLVAITGAGVEPGTARTGVPRRRPVQLGLLAPQLGGGPNGVHIDPIPAEVKGPLALRSTDHDADLTRLFACYDPFSGPGLKPTFYSGTFDGAWEGRFSFFDFDSYREMLAGQMRSLYTGPFGEQPQVWKLKEHFVKVGTSKSGGFKRGGVGSVITAGFDPESPIEDLTSQPRTLAEARERARERGGGKREASGGQNARDRSSRPDGEDSAANSTPVVLNEDDDDGDGDRLPEDLESYPQFSAEDGGPSAGYGCLPPGLSGIAGHRRSRKAKGKCRSNDDSGAATDDDNDDGDDSDDDSQHELLISGVGHSAWGRFYLRGRVRAWDGMVILSKEYRPDGRGRWLYRGYVVNGTKLIGRWRDTFTPGDMSGYEGPFILSKRGEDEDEAAS